MRNKSKTFSLVNRTLNESLPFSVYIKCRETQFHVKIQNIHKSNMVRNTVSINLSGFGSFIAPG